MTFTMKDTYGDPIEVCPEGVLDGRIYLTVTDGDDNAQAALTPKKARKLAKALKRAAKEASR